MPTPVWLLATNFEPRGRSWYTLRLAAHLPKFGFEPTIFCDSADLIPSEIRDRLCVRSIPHLEHPVLGWLAVRKLAREYADRRPALIHANRRRLDTVALRLASLLDRPYLITVHDVLPSKGSLTLLPERLGGVIAVSPSVQRDLVQGASVPEELTRMIPTGVEIPPNLRIPGPRPTSEIPIVGCASALEPSKGLSYFLLAAELILSSGHDVEFVVAGVGPEEETLRRIAQHLDVANRVTFVVPGRGFRRFLNTFDVFVLPSLEQGLGTIMFEAMCLGKPVVATKVGGVADFLVEGEHALFAPPANHTVLAEKIQLLLDNPDRARRLAAAGQGLVRREFSAEKMAQRTAELYRDVLDRQSPSPAATQPTHAGSPPCSEPS